MCENLPPATGKLVVSQRRAAKTRIFELISKAQSALVTQRHNLSPRELYFETVFAFMSKLSPRDQLSYYIDNYSFPLRLALESTPVKEIPKKDRSIRNIIMIPNSQMKYSDTSTEYFIRGEIRRLFPRLSDFGQRQSSL
jgi:hypothetical protein